jgi:putative PIN family toxin of toxin-antitoxin system
VRVVIDTNILISYLISPEGALSRLVNAWVRSRSLEVFTSEYQIAELKRVARYERIRRFVTDAQVSAFVTLLRRRGTVVKPSRVLRVSPDEDDDQIIAIALEAGASYLVSGDGDDLLALKVVEGVRVVRARYLLDRLKPRRAKRKDPKGLVKKTKRPAKKK